MSEPSGARQNASLDVAPEDEKLLTLARAARVRNRAAQGAAVRDDTGRTYVASSVSLPSLRLSALQAAVVIAVGSGADALEAAAVVTSVDAAADDQVAGVLAAADLAAVADLSPGVPVFVAGADGLPRAVVEARA